MKTIKLVSKGITSIGEVKRSIADFVEKELFHRVPVDKLECLSNQGYHPAKKDPWNHVLQAITAQEYCNDDQELLGRKIEEREEKPPSSKFFRPIIPSKPNRMTTVRHRKASCSKTLFIHQEEWHLLQRHDSELVFMDATYKTTKYAIPLFFVWVRNVDYKVVDEFMTQYEDEQSISMALPILKSWNPLWQPKYFMVDSYIVKIGATEEQFPEVSAYICDFHRLQAMQQ